MYTCIFSNVPRTQQQKRTCSVCRSILRSRQPTSTCLKRARLLSTSTRCVIAWHVHVCDRAQSCVSHDLFMFHVTSHSIHCECSQYGACVTWLIHVFGMSHSCVRHDSFIYATSHSIQWECSEYSVRVTWLIHVWSVTQSRVWHDSFMCHATSRSIQWKCTQHDARVTWLIHLCDMTHPCMRRDSFIRATSHSTQWHDSFMCGTWLIHVCDMTHLWVTNDLLLRDTSSTGGGGDMTDSYVGHDSFMCATRIIRVWHTTCRYAWYHQRNARVTWLNHMCVAIHSCVWHGLFTCVTWLIHMCDSTYVCVWHDSLLNVWHRQRGVSLSMYVCFGVCVCMGVCVCGHADSYVWLISCTYVIWLTYICDTTRSYLTWFMCICGAWKMSHVIHTCASLQNRVMLQIRMSHVISINESCHTYEVVMSHVWMSIFTCMNESRLTYQRVISRIRIRHATYSIRERVMLQIWGGYD